MAFWQDMDVIDSFSITEVDFFNLTVFYFAAYNQLKILPHL